MKGNANLILGNSNVGQGNVNGIKGNENMFLGSSNIIFGDFNALKGNSNFLQGKANTLIGCENSVSGNKNQAFGNGNDVIGDVNIIRGKTRAYWYIPLTKPLIGLFNNIIKRSIYSIYSIWVTDLQIFLKIEGSYHYCFDYKVKWKAFPVNPIENWVPETTNLSRNVNLRDLSTFHQWECRVECIFVKFSIPLDSTTILSCLQSRNLKALSPRRWNSKCNSMMRLTCASCIPEASTWKIAQCVWVPSTNGWTIPIFKYSNQIRERSWKQDSYTIMEETKKVTQSFI